VEAQDAIIMASDVPITISSPLSLLRPDEDESDQWREDEIAFEGGFLRPDYRPQASRPLDRLTSSNIAPAQRFTAWRGILRFRKSQQNLIDMADEEVEKE
jgi:hypothetical protein